MKLGINISPLGVFIFKYFEYQGADLILFVKIDNAQKISQK